MKRFATNAGDVLVGKSHGENALSSRPILIGADLLIDAEHTVQIHHFSLKWIQASVSSPSYEFFGARLHAYFHWHWAHLRDQGWQWNKLRAFSKRILIRLIVLSRVSSGILLQPTMRRSIFRFRSSESLIFTFPNGNIESEKQSE